MTELTAANKRRISETYIQSQQKWDSFWMGLVFYVAGKSKDDSSRIGSVVVGQNNEPITMGYNGLPHGVDDDVQDRHERPAKYFWAEHSERNSIYHAAKLGISLRGCKMYTVATPCADCARAIIQSGISEVIVCDVEMSPGWSDSQKAAQEMMKEAGVATRVFKGRIRTKIIGFIHGKEFDPNDCCKE